MTKNLLILLGLAGLVFGFSIAIASRFNKPAGRSSRDVGSPRIATIDGDSMAPTYCGECTVLTCPDCSKDLKVALLGEGARLTCWQCGFPITTSSDTLHYLPGEKVSLIPLHEDADYQRNDVVVIEDDASNDATPSRQIKRIVALPGETWGTAAGDVVINGEVLQKSLSELREVAIEVYDSQHRPTKSTVLRPRWTSRSQNAALAGETGWQLSASPNLAAVYGKEDSSNWQWLDYHHWRCTTNPLPRDEDSPLLDNDSYNSQLSRELNPVTDLLLEVSLVHSNDASFALQLSDPSDNFVARIDVANGTAQLFKSDVEIAAGKLQDRKPLPPPEQLFHFTFCDRQVILAIDGNLILTAPWNKPLLATFVENPPLPKIAIGASHGSMTIKRVRLLRDLYHLGPRGQATPWQSPAPLAAGTYAVLGDNSPVSIDSRHFAPDGIARRQITHRVTPAGR